MRLLLLLALLAGAASPAVAAVSETELREAKQHYDRGMTHYHLGEFPAAVDEFKAAYALSSAPGLLFNLGQASRLDHQYEQAIYFYRTYLRLSPEASNRADVEQRLAELEPLADQERARRQAAPTARATAPPLPLGTAAATRPAGASANADGRALKLAGYLVGGFGVATLATGAGLGGAALAAQDQISKLAHDMGSWSTGQADLYQRGHSEAIAATASYAVGGAALASGLVLYIVGRHRDQARFALWPAAGAAQAAWTF